MIEDLDRKLTNMNKSFESLITKYGEDPSKCTPEEFFGLLKNFLNSLQQVCRFFDHGGTNSINGEYFSWCKLNDSAFSQYALKFLQFFFFKSIYN